MWRNCVVTGGIINDPRNRGSACRCIKLILNVRFMNVLCGSSILRIEYFEFKTARWRAHHRHFSGARTPGAARCVPFANPLAQASGGFLSHRRAHVRGKRIRGVMNSVGAPRLENVRASAAVAAAAAGWWWWWWWWLVVACGRRMLDAVHERWRARVCVCLCVCAKLRSQECRQ